MRINILSIPFFSLQKLLSVLKRGELLAHGSRYEVEIRGCSIYAVTLVAEAAKKKDSEDEHGFTETSVDYFLWGFRREKAQEMENFPYHKTRSIFY